MIEFEINIMHVEQRCFVSAAQVLENWTHICTFVHNCRFCFHIQPTIDSKIIDSYFIVLMFWFQLESAGDWQPIVIYHSHTIATQSNQSCLPHDYLSLAYYQYVFTTPDVTKAY